MGFHVKQDDLTAFGFYASTKIHEWENQLEELTVAFNKILDMKSFKGATSASVKNYIAQVHTMAIVSLYEIMSKYSDNFLMYKDGYYTIEEDAHGKILEETWKTF